MKKVVVINGPNINLTGMREPGVYGSMTMEEIGREVCELGQKLRLQCDFYQSNSEGSIIDKIHEVADHYDGAILNAGAYTHYSYAIRDGIAAVRKPFIEVHMSNIYAREEFRSHSVIAGVCAGQITGLGMHSYLLALQALKALL